MIPREQHRRAPRTISRASFYAVEGTLRKAALIDGVFVDSLTIAKLLDDGPGWRPPELETARLLLRPVVLADAPSIFAYASDLEVTRYLSWKPHRTLRDSEAFIWDVALANYRKGIFDPWAITLRERPTEVIGTVGCFFVGASKHTMEVGYALGRPHWGHGFMTEAVKAILDCVFGIEGVRRVQAWSIVDNIGSARVMQKAGMNFEGTMKAAFQSPNIAPDGGAAHPEGPECGKLCDMHLYAVVRNDSTQNAP